MDSIMTKRNILAIIKEHNENKDIKWEVVENTKNLIVITNDYDSSIRFEIRLNQGEEKDISIKDVNGWQESVGYLLYGNKLYDDFSDIEEGIKMAVKAVVKFFYYYY